MPTDVRSQVQSTSRDDAADRRAANRAVGVSAAGLALTGVAELLLAVLTGSVALLGDAIHNLSDVSTSAVVFLGFRVSKKPVSRTHPYGYERAEDLAGLGVAAVIWLSAAFAGYESYRKLVGHGSTSNVWLGMAGAGLALVAAGYQWGDPVAGFAITLFICHVGYEVTGDMIHRLMDSLDPDELAAAEKAARAVDGVQSATVRGRWMGRSLLLEIESRLDGDTPLSQADHVNRQIEHAVASAVPAATHVHSDAHA
jgi:divalent metal cation (Fe/Co/Zn/Cd) transporter